jgi:hypothetical protein
VSVSDQDDISSACPLRRQLLGVHHAEQPRLQRRIRL